MLDHRASRVLLAPLALALLLAGPPRAQEIIALADLHLRVKLPALDQIERQPTAAGDRLRGLWIGQLGGSVTVSIVLSTLDARALSLREPDDVIDNVLSDYGLREKEGGLAVRVESRETLAGAFGWAPYACLLKALRLPGPKEKLPPTRTLVLAGLTEQHGYVIEVSIVPADAGGAEARMLSFLRDAVTYTGPVRQNEWTDAEALARWNESAPEDARKEFNKRPLRTAHYIVLTNSSGGAAFGRKMEECLEAIRKVYPFPDQPLRRLLPVLLFRTPQQYWAFYSKAAGIPIEQAQRSKGHAWKDYYATWYEAANDPVHVHEATHQVFANCLHLPGGGSWFQEGVAEYMSTKKVDRGAAARAVRNGRHTPLSRFVTIQSLLHSAEEDKKGHDEADDHYAQAAVLIEFARESPFGKARFLDFVHAIGAVPANNVPAIEAALRKVYGVDLAGFEKEWAAYCGKR